MHVDDRSWRGVRVLSRSPVRAWVLAALLPALAAAQNPPDGGSAAPPASPAAGEEGPPREARWSVARAAPERVTFAEAMRRARIQATSASIAAEEVRRAQALLTEARAPSLPLLSANGSYTRLDADRRTSAGVFAYASQWDANAQLSVPLLAGSRWAAWRAAAENVAVARASEEDVRRTVLLTAARAYLSILTQKRVVEVSRSALDIARARFDFARARLSGGVGVAVDDLRAEQQVAAAEVNLAQGELGVVRAQEALGTAAGVDAPLDAADEPSFVAEIDPASAEARRLDLRAARERLTAAALVRRTSWTDWLPTLFFTAEPFVNDPGTATNPSSGWQVQLLLSLPIFEGGLRLGLLREREAFEREARIQVDAALRQVRSDVRLAAEEVTKTESALAAARLAGARARRVLALEVQAYRAGAVTDLDVTTAQQQSRDADLQVVIGEDAVRQARLDLLAAVGQFP